MAAGKVAVVTQNLTLLHSNHSHLLHTIMTTLHKVKEDESPEAECPALDSIVWRKLDMRLLPLCTCVFLVANLVCL